jgi:uncharacterized protein YkwD
MLRRVLLLGGVAVALAACGTGSVVKTGRTESVPVDSRAAAALISQYRAAHNLGPVTVDSGLTRAADHQARANAEVGYLSHDVGGEFASRLAAVGFSKSYAAENLGAGGASLEETIARWKASPEHNKNLLMPQVQRIGIARVDAPGSRYRRFWALVLSSS